MIFLIKYNVITTNVSNVQVNTKIILFGPAGFNGTEAFCNVVNAGVCINNFACAC